MSESKSDALPLGDIPVSERRPLAGHTRYYTTAFPFWQSFFSVFYRRFPRKSHPDKRVIISRFSPDTLHSNSRKKPQPFGRGLVFALPIFPGSRPRSSSAYMSLTSVFGMAASPSAACGRVSEGAACAAVDKIEHPSQCDDFIGHRKRKQEDPHDSI